MTKEQKKFKLDIQKLLKALDLRDKGFYKNLEDDEKKAIPFPVLRRWMSTVGDVDWNEGKKQGRFKGDKKGPWPIGDERNTAYYLIMVNEIANYGFMDLYKHPELQWLLLCIVGRGQPKSHQWLPSKKVNIKNVEEIYRKKYPLASYTEIRMLITLSREQEFKQLLCDMGYQDKEIMKLMLDYCRIRDDG